MTRTIDKLECKEYHVIISGNDGEEELIIAISCGQGGLCCIGGLIVSCDGGMEALPIVKVEDELAAQLIHQIISDWAGTPSPMATQRATSSICKHFYLPGGLNG